MQRLKKYGVTGITEGSRNNDKANVDSVTFDTNLKISNHSRNKLQSMENLGFASSQKNAVDVALDSFIQSLPEEERRKLLLQIKTLETKDVRLYQKKANSNLKLKIKF